VAEAVEFFDAYGGGQRFVLIGDQDGPPAIAAAADRFGDLITKSATSYAAAGGLARKVRPPQVHVHLPLELLLGHFFFKPL